MEQRLGMAEWGMLGLLSILWGGAFLFNGIAVKGLAPFTIVALRVTLAALTLLALCRMIGAPLPAGAKSWGRFVVLGFFNNLLPFCLIVWGQTRIGSGLASILNAMTPVFSVVVAHVLTRDERMTASRFAGAMVGFVGVAVMIGPEALKGEAGDFRYCLAVLAAALSYAFSGVFSRRFRAMNLSPLTVATGQVSAASMMLLPVAAIIDAPWRQSFPGVEIVGAVIGLAVFSTAFAYVLFFRIVATAGATNALLVTFLIPVSAIVAGWLCLGERLDGRQLIGFSVIVLGLALIDGRVLPFFRSMLRPACRASGKQHG